jgi:L-aminopeptidase/D-esterase-like protein
LAAATGVVRFLREKGAGFATGPIRVPIVPAAVIYDYPANLSNGALPDEAMGYAAAVNASSAPALSGPLGAGFSAASGLLGGPNGASPSGLGSFGEARPNGLKVAALVVVNSLGSVVNPQTGAIVSGLISSKGGLATRSEILGVLEKSPPTRPGQTVLAVVATNAPLDKLNAFRLARMACCGLSRAIFPAHLMFDGDVVFALSLGSGPEANISYLGALAAEILSEAILRSVP